MKISRNLFSVLEQVVGGVDMMSQAIALAKRPHIVVLYIYLFFCLLHDTGLPSKCLALHQVGTPGRLVDHLTNTKGFSLRTIKYLVIFCEL